MRKREMPSCSLSRCVVALCVGAALAVLTVPPGGVRAAAMSDSEFVRLCAEGTADQVKQALKDGADPNAKDESGLTVLMQAAWSHESEKVRLLLDAGADGSLKDKDGRETPLKPTSLHNYPYSSCRKIGFISRRPVFTGIR